MLKRIYSLFAKQAKQPRQPAYQSASAEGYKNSLNSGPKTPLGLQRRFGNKSADAVITYAKTKYFEGLRANTGLNGIPSAKRPKAATEYMMIELRDFLQKAKRYDIIEYLYGGSNLPSYSYGKNFRSFRIALEKTFTDEEQEEVNKLLSMSHGVIEGSIRGIKGHKLKIGRLGSFAKAVTAAETGQEAQAKNPRPRRDRSRDRMNKPQDP